MKQEKEPEIVRIRTIKGRIITLTISKRTETHLTGKDKYGDRVKIPLDDIDLMLPTGGYANG